MPFIRLPGLAGKVYVPNPPPDPQQKHPCPDCFACQECPESRCQVCRCNAGCKKKGPPSNAPAHPNGER